MRLPRGLGPLCEIEFANYGSQTNEHMSIVTCSVSGFTFACAFFGNAKWFTLVSKEHFPMFWLLRVKGFIFISSRVREKKSFPSSVSLRLWN